MRWILFSVKTSLRNTSRRVLSVGQHSIRINDQWRICFRWQSNDAYEVEIVDYH